MYGISLDSCEITSSTFLLIIYDILIIRLSKNMVHKN